MFTVMQLVRPVTNTGSSKLIMKWTSALMMQRNVSMARPRLPTTTIPLTPLDYLWIQLDQNVRALDSDTYKIGTSSVNQRMTLRSLSRLEPTFDGGFRIDYVKDGNGKPVKYTIEKTMMRIDLADVLQPGTSTELQLKWWYNVNDRMKDGGGRSGSEYFEEDDNYLYTIAQFFPRMAVYIDNEGWQNKQFLGSGEFAPDLWRL